MTKSKLRLVTRALVNRAVATPRRPSNAELRTREHLTEAEVEQLIDAAKANRWGCRDALMILLAYRHGLRAAEVCDLRWEQVDFKPTCCVTPAASGWRTMAGTPGRFRLTSATPTSRIQPDTRRLRPTGLEVSSATNADRPA